MIKLCYCATSFIDELNVVGLLRTRLRDFEASSVYMVYNQKVKPVQIFNEEAATLQPIVNRSNDDFEQPISKIFLLKFYDIILKLVHFQID